MAARILTQDIAAKGVSRLEVNAVQLRLARHADAERLVPLINSAFRRAEGFLLDDDRIDLEEVQSLQARGKFLVAEGASSLAGCVYVELKGERAYLGLLSVDPALQGGGIGSTLMRAAEEHCAMAGCRFMDLKIINLRKDNHTFYTRRGYVETSTERFPDCLNPKQPCHFVNMSKQLG